MLRNTRNTRHDSLNYLWIIKQKEIQLHKIKDSIGLFKKCDFLLDSIICKKSAHQCLLILTVYIPLRFWLDLHLMFEESSTALRTMIAYDWIPWEWQYIRTIFKCWMFDATEYAISAFKAETKLTLNNTIKLGQIDGNVKLFCMMRNKVKLLFVLYSLLQINTSIGVPWWLSSLSR